MIEFNARFGDPEAMNVLSLLTSDLSEIVHHIAEGSLSPSHVSFDTQATVCKYLVPDGYPGFTPSPGIRFSSVPTMMRSLLCQY